jgi:hypothetical protein
MANTSPATLSFSSPLNEGLPSAGAFFAATDAFAADVITNSSPEAAGPRSPTLYIRFFVANSSLGYAPRYVGSVGQKADTCVFGGPVSVYSASCASLGITVNAATGTITLLNTPLTDRNNPPVSQGTVSGTLNVLPF